MRGALCSMSATLSLAQKSRCSYTRCSPVSSSESARQVQSKSGAESTFRTDLCFEQLVKSDLVSNQTLALISSRLGFPSQLRAAAAQLYQLRNNPLVQAALFEAYLAQLHVEKGHTAFQSFVTSLYSPLVPVVVQASRSAQPAPLTTALIGLVNYVGILMEWTQRTRGRDGRTVTFAPSRCGGADHKPLWVASCKVEESKMRGVTDLSTYEGMGSSVAEAKRECVRHILSLPDDPLWLTLSSACSAAYQACLDLGLA